jgi:hypothetical protein
VDEAVHAAEIDERTEVDDAADTPSRISPGLRLVRNCRAFLLGLFQPGTAGQHHVVAVLVELDDLRLERLARRTGARSRTRRSSTSDAGRKPRRPMSTMRPPLTTSMTGPDDDAFGFLDLLDGAPGTLVLGTLLGQDQAAFLVFLGEDEGLDPSRRATRSRDGSTSLRIDSSRPGMTPSDL